MPQFTRFMPLPPEAPSIAVERVLKGLRKIPLEGEPFREFRTRLKRLDIYSRERMPQVFAMLRLADDDPIVPGPLLRSIIEAPSHGDACTLFAERLYAVNPVLFKSVYERLKERADGKSSLLKYLHSFAYPGTPISNPELNNWFDWAVGLELLRPLGVGLALGPRMEGFEERLKLLDVDEYIEEDEPEAPPQPVEAPVAATEAEAPAGELPAEQAGAPVEEAPAAAQKAGPSVAVSAAVAPVVVEVAPPPLELDLESAGNPCVAESVAPEGWREAVDGVFPADTLRWTAHHLDRWWQRAGGEHAQPLWVRLGIDGEAWQEDPEWTLYRLAIAAKLRALGEGDTPQGEARVIERLAALEAEGVLATLYQGEAVGGPLPQIDPNILLNASQLAWRLDQSPDLVQDLERAEGATAVRELLGQAFGRGLLDEQALEWLVYTLSRSGVVRLPDLAPQVIRYERDVRDTLYLLGFLPSPYAVTAAQHLRVSLAARQALPSTEHPERGLRAFAWASKQHFQCDHQVGCQLPCRERFEVSEEPEGGTEAEEPQNN